LIIGLCIHRDYLERYYAEWLILEVQMLLGSFLSSADALRAAQTLNRLFQHDISEWTLTGGFATEFHILQRGGKCIHRPLNDIDFVVDSFGFIPESLGKELLFRHVHPYDPPAKTILQAVDPETGVRIDVFRAYGSAAKRALRIAFAAETLRIISLEDLTAHTARLCLDLGGNLPVAPKYARDLLRLLEVVNTAEVEPAWQEHRKPGSPESFVETAKILCRLIQARPDLLFARPYSTDVEAVCERCHHTAAFPLAEPRQILSLLGYC
jgi:hypothetical protein